MILQEQIRLHKEFSKKIEELEEKKQQLSAAVLQQMQDETLRLPGFVVRRCSRLSIKLSLDEAHSYNSVKVEETVDKDKIKVLYKRGQCMSGVSEIQYLQIKELGSS